MSEAFFCEICGQEYSTDQMYSFDNQDLCPGCLDAHTAICHECDTRIWQDNNAGSIDHPLCQSCYDDEYTNCFRCGALLRESTACYEDADEFDERPYCDGCYHTVFKDTPIHDYYYKPKPVFYGVGPRYFGVELEIDGAGERSDYARSLLDAANRNDECIYIKHDGSLNEGLELVTHPMSLDDQLHRVPWEDICHKAVSLGYRSHRADTCGLHVHVSRSVFGETEREQDAAIARVLYFFEKHWEELLKFSRRTRRQLERWAARYGYKEQPMEILDYAKKGYHGSRYTCINLHNADTVEFRMFQGTLKANTIFATLQLLDRICDVALFMSDEELKGISWTSFAAGCTAPELIQYLKERRLYVNEPVETEVEL